MKRDRLQMGSGLNAVCLILSLCLTIFGTNAAIAGDTAPGDGHPVAEGGRPATGAPAASEQKSVTTNKISNDHKQAAKKRSLKKKVTQRAAHKHKSRDFPQRSTNMMDPNHITTPVGK